MIYMYRYICILFYVTRLDESSRKIYKDGKRYTEANNGKIIKVYGSYIRDSYFTILFCLPSQRSWGLKW